MTKPKVSLVIPTYQRTELLKEMLLALEGQTLPFSEFEVVVVIDGGADQTWKMLQSLAQSYDLRPVRQEQLGPAAARNHGARVARGEVIAFLDDDMLPANDFLAEHLQIHEAFPKSVVLGPVVAPSLRTIARQGGWNVWEARVLRRHYKEVANGQRPPAGRRLYSGNFSVRKDDFWRTGGFDESLLRGEDVELGFRLEREGLTYRFNDRTAALHRGFRSFDSWCQSAYTYGQCDALFAQQKGHNVIPEVVGWYYKQRTIARLTIDLCMERQWLQRVLLRTLEFISGGLTQASLHDLAHYGYSAIYKLQYWKGFVEALGGKAAFRAHAAIRPESRRAA